MKKLYVHAGMPKCGTSALQVFWAQNSDELRRNGIDYLPLGDLSAATAGEITSGNAGPLARSMYPAEHTAKKGSKKSHIDELIKSILDSPCEQLLISSELFMMVPIPELKKFKSELDAAGIEVIYTYYVRRQDQSILSTYMQRVKRHGYSAYPEEHVRKVYKKAEPLRYHTAAKKFEGVFGSGNVIPLCYEDCKNHPKGIIGHFFSRIFSVVPDWITTPEVVNVSPTPLELKFQLMANVYSPKSKFSDLLVRNSAIAGRGGVHKKHSLIPADLVQEVMDFFSDENRKMKKDFGISFPEIEVDEYVDIRNMEVNVDDLMSVFIGLLVALDKKIPAKKI